MGECECQWYWMHELFSLSLFHVMWTKNTEIILHIHSHTLSVRVDMYTCTFVCLFAYGSMWACMSSSTHMQYAFSKHTSEQRIAPQRLMLMKINRPTVFRITLFSPFHLYIAVSVSLICYLARATNLISLSKCSQFMNCDQIGYFLHTQNNIQMMPFSCILLCFALYCIVLYWTLNWTIIVEIKAIPSNLKWFKIVSNDCKSKWNAIRVTRKKLIEWAIFHLSLSLSLSHSKVQF